MKTNFIEKVFYKKGETLTFEEAKQKALLFLDYIRTTNETLEDYWYGISDNWDLNIWREIEEDDCQEDKEGLFLRATLYPVVDGFTKTQNFIRIYP